MKWLNNMKIRAKIIMCFSILAIFTTVVGVFGISNMDKINIRSESMYNDNLLPIQYVMSIQNELQDISVNHLLAIYEKNPETLQSKLDEINSSVETDDQFLTDYEKTIQDDNERMLYTEVKNSLAEYRTLREANLELVKDEKYDAALATLSEVEKASSNTDEALQELVEYNKLLASQALLANEKNYSQQSKVMITVIISGVIIAISLGIAIARLISNQLNHLVAVADKIADGNLDVTVDIDSKDEVGILGKSFKKMAENINEAMSNIYTASEQVASGASQVSDSSMALSQGATEQASSIEQLTASLEEISSQTKLNADNANQANSLARDAKSTALQGNVQMKEMLKAMEEINDSSNSISKIIKVIDDIAFQTNILALNAAVEAARAGQHGKGFAVVAEEVRTLAARSASAAKETTDMIEGSIKKAEGGTKIANSTADSLNEIVKGIEKVAVLVNDIANASNEQANGIGQINQGIMQVSDVVQKNSATSEESAAASEELSSQAELLKETVSRFKLKKVSKAYYSQDEINPDVIKMLDNMADKKKDQVYNVKDGRHKAVTERPRIALSDNEFGKY